VKNKKAFYAYASNGKDLLEDIHEAVKIINDSKGITITTWEDLAISGKSIIKGILRAIDECDLFICDLTYLNFNVLYELGYAISKEKKIWITLNKSHAKAVANYRTLKSITTIGYAGYENSKELANTFFSEAPHEYSESIDIKSSQVDITRNLIYLTCEKNTSASNKVSSLIKKSSLPQKMDDPYEGNQPLSWYLNVLPNALGVVIHFHTKDSEEENPIITARKALVAGMSKGWGLKTLLLAHEPFQAPLDYQDLLKIHSSADECETYFKEWFDPVLADYKSLEEDYTEYKSEQKALGKLSSLIIGDYVAENENHDLVEYFLETAEYKEALNSQQVLFVGRKGTGKTANLIKLKNELSADKRNFIIPIQPQGHEFEGILNIFTKLRNEAEQGHLIESIWKCLIYTEMAKQYFEYLDALPLHHQRSKQEEEFFEFVKKNERLINADFTLRLDNIISSLSNLTQSQSMEEQRLKVSEYLHDTVIKQLRDHLGNILENKEKVTILIDNLDKNWNDNAEIEKLSHLLFGLLNVAHKITDEFHKSSYKHLKVNLSLIVFIRSDIFSRLMSFASERDKIPTKHLSWSEPLLLFRVIENRIQYSRDGITSPEALWDQYFCKEIDGVPLKKFVTDLILPRPRDIIYLFKAALQEAINRGHSKVEEDDFKSAEYSYSEYALQSLFPENGGRIQDLESLFYEFAGENSIITHEQLEEYLEQSNPDRTEELIEILCEMTFIGKEIQDDKFQYYSEKRPSKVINRLAQRLAERNSRSQRYKINPAFYAYLGIEKSKNTQYNFK
uniref:P-loop ATPase, Sll1717 family n=1 Tax=Priestia megaterium TaxID=1404 RepID=UPI002ABDB9B1